MAIRIFHWIIPKYTRSFTKQSRLFSQHLDPHTLSPCCCYCPPFWHVNQIVILTTLRWLIYSIFYSTQMEKLSHRTPKKTPLKTRRNKKGKRFIMWKNNTGIIEKNIYQTLEAKAHIPTKQNSIRTIYYLIAESKCYIA
jgi:hypothetical protein